MYSTLVCSFSQLSELFGRTDQSEPTGRSISTLSSRAWSWQPTTYVWCFCLSFQFLEYNFCTEFLCRFYQGFMFMFILIWILISSFGAGEWPARRKESFLIGQFEFAAILSNTRSSAICCIFSCRKLFKLKNENSK